MTAVVVAERLSKWYGRRLAVADVSFSVEPGEVIGLLGPNGSGKSTIFRILTGYLAPSSGTARVAGYDVVTESLAMRREVGYVPEDAPVYDHMRVAEFLRFMAEVKGLRGAAIERAVAAAAARLELERVMTLPAGKLSRGFRQRLAIAQALLTEPKLLVLDEPTSGLDPHQVIDVRELIKSLAGTQTIILASHVLTEIEKIATRTMILLDGRLLTADALRADPETMRLRLRATGSESTVHTALRRVAGISAVSAEPGSDNVPRTYVLEAKRRDGLAAEVAAALAVRSLPVSELVETAPDLEQIFLDLTRRTLAATA